MVVGGNLGSTGGLGGVENGVRTAQTATFGPEQGFGRVDGSIGVVTRFNAVFRVSLCYSIGLAVHPGEFLRNPAISLNSSGLLRDPARKPLKLQN